MVWISRNNSVLVLNAPAGRHSIHAVHSANEFHPGFIVKGKKDLEVFPPEVKKYRYGYRKTTLCFDPFLLVCMKLKRKLLRKTHVTTWGIEERRVFCCFTFRGRRRSLKVSRIPLRRLGDCILMCDSTQQFKTLSKSMIQ